MMTITQWLVHWTDPWRHYIWYRDWAVYETWHQGTINLCYYCNDKSERRLWITRRQRV